MTGIKALLAGLFGVSFCMANISGIVTDTGTTPVAGAVVQLEKGGQSAISGTDGSFTISTTAIVPVNGASLPNVLSAKISGHMLNVTIAERAAIEVATFDLNGGSLSTVRRTLNAGSHSLSLKYRGAGIYLYKVKSGNSEFVLKGISVDRVSSGSTASPQGSPSYSPAKQAVRTAAINDVIAATKTGFLDYRMAVMNSDTSGIAIKLIACAGTVTDADGNVYQAVKIGNQEWMAENLRTTKYNDGSAISLVADKAAWRRIHDSSLTTPAAYCYYNNTTAADSIRKYGALYNWHVVSPANLKKIAPAGWHVPSDAEWDTLQNYLISRGCNWDGTTTGNKIAKSLAAKTEWRTNANTGTIGCALTKNNSSGFSALPGSYRFYDGMYYGQSDNGYWWSATEYDATHALFRHLNFDGVIFGRFFDYRNCGFSVRLVRD